jgi:hypothetical protein
VQVYHSKIFENSKNCSSSFLTLSSLVLAINRHKGLYNYRQISTKNQGKSGL